MTRNWPLFSSVDCLANQRDVLRQSTRPRMGTDHSSVRHPLSLTTEMHLELGSLSSLYKIRVSSLGHPGLVAFYPIPEGLKGVLLYQQFYSSCILRRSDHGHTRVSTNQKFHIYIFKIQMSFLEKSTDLATSSLYSLMTSHSSPLWTKHVLSPVCHSPPLVWPNVLTSITALLPQSFGSQTSKVL